MSIVCHLYIILKADGMFKHVLMRFNAV
jgi:hypothetical protein